MVDIEPYKTRARTNLQEHNDIISKVNEVVQVINDTDMDNLNTRLTNDESQIAVNTANIKSNTTAINGLTDSVTSLNTEVDTLDASVSAIEPQVATHTSEIAELKTEESRLSASMPKTYTLYRDGEGKIKAQVETADGTLVNSNTLDMVIPYQYDIVSGTTNRSFKLNITMSDGSSYTTNDFVIPEGGGTDITVTGITLSKDSTNVNRFHVGINLSDGSMIDSGFITIVDSVSGTFSDNKLVITVNGVSSVPIGIDTTGTVYDAGNGITIADGTISIDSTVVALKTDIADMETKTNASATYATKTALATTDTNVALAKSTADDANNKANNCIDNVSITDNVLTFTKTDDTHIDITLPSRTIERLDSAIKLETALTTNSSTLSYTSTKLASYIKTNAWYFDNDKNLVKAYMSKYTGGVEETVTIYQVTNLNTLVTEYFTKLHNLVNFSDGTYIFSITSPYLIWVNYDKDVFSNHVVYRIIVSDGELTSVTQWTSYICYIYKIGFYNGTFVLTVDALS